MQAADILANRAETDSRRRAYAYGAMDGPFIPVGAVAEYKRLSEKARFDVTGLVLDAYTQAITVESFHDADDKPSMEAWRCWEASGIPLRESAIVRAALTHGATYLMIDPGSPYPLWRHVAHDRVVYAASVARPAGGPLWVVEQLSETEYMVYAPEGTSLCTFAKRPTAKKSVLVSQVEMETIGKGRVPVARLAVELDDREHPVSEVERLIAPQDRVTQTLFDLLMVQTYGAFRVRTVTGWAPKDDTEVVKVAVNRMLATANDNAKWGTLDATPVDGYLKVFAAAVADMLQRVQMPPHRAGGMLSDNLSADAQAQVDTGFTQRVGQRQRGLAAGIGRALDLSASVSKVEPGLKPHWADSSMLPLSATVDALVKARFLGIPGRALWERIPGVSTNDVMAWEKLPPDAPLPLPPMGSPKG